MSESCRQKNKTVALLCRMTEFIHINAVASHFFGIQKVQDYELINLTHRCCKNLE